MKTKAGSNALLVSEHKLYLSRHALDRAVERCGDLFRKRGKGGEKFTHWLAREAKKAYKRGVKDENGYYLSEGIRFAVKEVGDSLLLKTVVSETGGGSKATILDFVKFG